MSSVELLLEQWGFPKNVLDVFKENDVDLQALQLLDDVQINMLILVIRPQANFKKALSNWKVSPEKSREILQREEVIDEIISKYGDAMEGLSSSLTSPTYEQSARSPQHNVFPHHQAPHHDQCLRAPATVADTYYLLLTPTQYLIFWNSTERDYPDDEDDADQLIPAIPEDTPQVPYQPPRRSDEEVLQKSREYYELMAQRRTVRAFSPEPIPQEVLDTLIKTAGTSPSGAHTEPWTFVVVQDREMKEAIRVIVEEEEELNYAKRMSRQWVTDLKPFATRHVKPYLSDAPALVLVFRQTHSWRPEGKKKMHYYSEISVAVAAGILLAAIQYCGLVALTSTPLNCNARVKDLLSRPVNERLELLLPVGRPHEDATVPDLHRKTLEEIMVRI